MILGFHRGNKISSTGTISKPKAIGSKNYLFFILRNYSRKTFMYKSYIYNLYIIYNVYIYIYIIYAQIHFSQTWVPAACKSLAQLGGYRPVFRVSVHPEFLWSMILTWDNCPRLLRYVHHDAVIFRSCPLRCEKLMLMRNQSRLDEIKCDNTILIISRMNGNPFTGYYDGYEYGVITFFDVKEWGARSFGQLYMLYIYIGIYWEKPVI